MKKILLALFLLSILTSDSFAAAINVNKILSPDDVTIEVLENMRSTFQGAINSADGSLIQGTSVSSGKLDANTNPENRWDEAFTDFVYTGLLPPTSTTLTSTTTAGTAYIFGVRVIKDAISKVYTASTHTYVDLSKTGTFTYQEVAINAAAPSVSTNSIRLARVSTDTTKVLSVRDDRVVNISIGSPKVGSFTRDTSTASGTQAVTGLGFTPRAVIFLAIQNTTREMSIGFDDGTNTEMIFDDQSSAGTYSGGSSISIRDSETGGTAEYDGKISTLDSDGFTMTWTKTGTPTGTLTIRYIVFR